MTEILRGNFKHGQSRLSANHHPPPALTLSAVIRAVFRVKNFIKVLNQSDSVTLSECKPRVFEYMCLHCSILVHLYLYLLHYTVYICIYTYTYNTVPLYLLYTYSIYLQTVYCIPASRKRKLLLLFFGTVCISACCYSSLALFAFPLF